MAWILDKQCASLLQPGHSTNFVSSGEGLVIKNLDSVYTLHGREDDWVKVKPEYMDSLGEEVDVSQCQFVTIRLTRGPQVLVMGGYWGSGTRGGTIGSFVCGVVDKGAIDGPRSVSCSSCEVCGS